MYVTIFVCFILNPLLQKNLSKIKIRDFDTDPKLAPNEYCFCEGDEIFPTRGQTSAKSYTNDLDKLVVKSL